ncbi:MAG: TolC family protein, partial [Bacteroidaceae bacterium]|nr:TolC family protein [Bacteroidaceae bacterium]
GWNRQRIEPLQGLNSFMVSMSVPLIFAPQLSRSRQAKMSWKMAEQEAEMNRKQLLNNMMERYNQLAREEERLNVFEHQALSEANALYESAILQFREGDTDIAELVQSIQNVLSVRESYLKTLLQHNITVLELELYTE